MENGNRFKLLSLAILILIALTVFAAGFLKAAPGAVVPAGSKSRLENCVFPVSTECTVPPLPEVSKEYFLS